MVVNGKVQPFYDIEPRRYRLRIANTANSRFFSLSLSNGQSFLVIGSDQGLLSAPVERKRLVLAPAKRTDIVVDFSSAHGQAVVLMSEHLQLMQFRVGDERVVDESLVLAVLRQMDRIDQTKAIRTRELTLNKFDSDDGQVMVMLLNRKHWAEPVTENVQLDSTEYGAWSILPKTLIRSTCIWCAFRFSTDRVSRPTITCRMGGCDSPLRQCHLKITSWDGRT